MKDLDRDREVDVRRLVVLLRALLEYTHGELAVTKIHTFFFTHRFYIVSHTRYMIPDSVILLLVGGKG